MICTTALVTTVLPTDTGDLGDGEEKARDDASADTVTLTICPSNCALRSLMICLSKQTASRALPFLALTAQ